MVWAGTEHRRRLLCFFFFSIHPKQSTKWVASQFQNGEWTVLDVRPPEEVEKGEIEGAVTEPLFIVDPDRSVSGLLKQASAFGFGGLWSGTKHMTVNESFMRDVKASIPTESKVIVACQKGKPSNAQSLLL